MPRAVVLVSVVVFVLALPARAVMPPPVRLALLFDRAPWARVVDPDPRPAWQIAIDWSPHGSP